MHVGIFKYCVIIEVSKMFGGCCFFFFLGGGGGGVFNFFLHCITYSTEKFIM